MAMANIGGLHIAWESFGEGDALLLVAGAGAQMLHWPERFCEALASEGFRVIRFDNRDSGLSTVLDALATPSLPRVLARYMVGLSSEVPYGLEDMGDDAARLMDALGIEQAHVVGASMGGALAQSLACHHPERVRSLVSMMSTTGGRWASSGRMRGIRVMITPPPSTREGAMKHAVWALSLIGSRRYPTDEGETRQRAALAFDRCHDPSAHARQMAAIFARGDRARTLAKIQCPTLVLHGADDALITPRGGRATTRAIPGATFRLIKDMGHDLPEPLWPELVSIIAHHARTAA
jgi:pimeloyl-ACP methyl ester carboxylesterase